MDGISMFQKDIIFLISLAKTKSSIFKKVFLPLSKYFFLENFLFYAVRFLKYFFPQKYLSQNCLRCYLPSINSLNRRVDCCQPSRIRLFIIFQISAPTGPPITTASSPQSTIQEPTPPPFPLRKRAFENWFLPNRNHLGQKHVTQSPRYNQIPMDIEQSVDVANDLIHHFLSSASTVAYVKG